METARLRLRPWAPSDAAAIRRLWEERDPRSLHVIDSNGRPTIEDFRVGIEEDLAESARTGLALLAIETKHDGGLIGYCGLIVGKGGLHANTLRICPPLIVTKTDVDAAIGVLDEAFTVAANSAD